MRFAGIGCVTDAGKAAIGAERVVRSMMAHYPLKFVISEIQILTSTL